MNTLKSINGLARAMFTILGVVVGYCVFLVLKLILESSHIFDLDEKLSGAQMTLIGMLFAIIFCILFYAIAPHLLRFTNWLADQMSMQLDQRQASDIVVAAIGLIAGMLVALLSSQIFQGITNQDLYTVITILNYIVFSFLGVAVAVRKSGELFGQISEARISEAEAIQGATLPRGKQRASNAPKILDTSVIIDGRIADIMKTGFIEGNIIIPEFVLVELRHIADSSDSLKRVRGRRGLDVLNKIQEEYGIEVYNTDAEKSIKEIPEVDVKLLKLAQIMNGKVVTNDFNLNKVAGINNVEVLNINELANSLKPIAIPGETMVVELLKQGKDNNQAVAYLDDGTMIVVEDGRRMIGKTTEITVTSVIQTAAGRMIFGRLKGRI